MQVYDENAKDDIMVKRGNGNVVKKGMTPRRALGDISNRISTPLHSKTPLHSIKTKKTPFKTTPHDIIMIEKNNMNMVDDIESASGGLSYDQEKEGLCFTPLTKKERQYGSSCHSSCHSNGHSNTTSSMMFPSAMSLMDNSNCMNILPPYNDNKTHTPLPEDLDMDNMWN